MFCSLCGVRYLLSVIWFMLSDVGVDPSVLSVVCCVLCAACCYLVDVWVCCVTFAS